MDKELWQKISGSINFHIRGLDEQDFVSSNEELLEVYLGDLKDIDTGVYTYLDKKTFKFIELNEDDIEKIKQAFLERVEKKKQKCLDNF